MMIVIMINKESARKLLSVDGYVYGILYGWAWITGELSKLIKSHTLIRYSFSYANHTFI